MLLLNISDMNAFAQYDSDSSSDDGSQPVHHSEHPKLPPSHKSSSSSQSGPAAVVGHKRQRPESTPALTSLTAVPPKFQLGEVGLCGADFGEGDIDLDAILDDVALDDRVSTTAPAHSPPPPRSVTLAAAPATAAPTPQAPASHAAPTVHTWSAAPAVPAAPPAAAQPAWMGAAADASALAAYQLPQHGKASYTTSAPAAAAAAASVTGSGAAPAVVDIGAQLQAARTWDAKDAAAAAAQARAAAQSRKAIRTTKYNPETGQMETMAAGAQGPGGRDRKGGISALASDFLANQTKYAAVHAKQRQQAAAAKKRNGI